MNTFTPTFDDICAFANLGLHPGNFAKKVWVSPAIEMPPHLRMKVVQKLRPQYDGVLTHLGHVPEAWEKTYKEVA